ncbi:phage terminase large subunit [Hymenobacter sp. DH14]|uniref:Phage terminase large subunit n=1 Tax=Hymenobacter cyanobacteriorum TaxID=2926463 RepID=A0A9X1VFY4_9BACT|nr:phage terminase large subunit [Hymenobacter cyanobacteriorum]MCI1187875.1 phage terminase large subunit [Hymenobacter cyanobacteriorum]
MTEPEVDYAMLLSEVSEDELVASLCEDRFYFFFLEFWETIEAVELVPNWHIEYLCDQLQQVYEAWAAKRAQPDVLINVPPGTSKSTTVTQLFPAWLWLKHAGIRILSSSHTAPLATSHAVKSRLCLKSPKFQRLFPGRLDFQDDQDGKTDYRNTALGQRFSTSTGTGGAMGNHADFILIDDPLNPQGGASENGRRAAEDHLKTLATRKTDKARSVTVLVMQRIHELDPAGLWLASGRRLRHICLPGELTKDAQTGELGKQVRPAELVARYTDGLLDTSRLGREVLEGLKTTLGSYGYAGQVQQLPSPDEGGILKKTWFRTISVEAFQALAGPRGAVWLFDADTAYTADQKNDPSALVASCYLGQTLYVRYAGEMWLELPDLKKRLPELLAAHSYSRQSKLYVEPKASGKSVVQELRAISQLNVVEAPSPTGSKLERVHGVSPFIEAGRVVLLDGAWNEAFVTQCAGFPTAAHDDMLDCLCQAIARYNLKPRRRSALSEVIT